MKLSDWLRRWTPWMGVCAIVLFMVVSGAMETVQQRERYSAGSFAVYLEESAARQAEDAQQTQTSTQNTLTVYATPSGKRYHLDSTCSGGNGREITWDEVAARGLTPCKKCAGG